MLLLEVLVGLGCYVYLYLKDYMSFFDLALSSLIVLNALICPYTNSQLLKIYPNIINVDLPKPRHVVILLVWMIFNVIFVGFVISFSIEYFYENNLVLKLVGLYSDFYLSLTVFMTIIQNMIFYGCATQKFMDNCNGQRLLFCNEICILFIAYYYR